MSDRRHHQRGIDQWRQIDEPHPIGELRQRTLGGGDGQPGLPNASRARQRQGCVMIGEEGAKSRHLHITPDQGRRLGRQIVQRGSIASGDVENLQGGWERSGAARLHVRSRFLSVGPMI